MTTTHHARDMLTPDEAADLIGCAAQTLAYWRCTRRYHLPWIKVGRAVRYRRADVEAWLESRTVRPVAVA